MILRATIRTAVALAVCAGSLVAVSGTASPGGAEFEILKELDGVPPAGTRFRVTVSCEGVILQPQGSSQVVLDFAADGTPLATAAFRFDGDGTCTITETATGGAASVSYQCFQTAGGEGEGGPPPCAPAGPQTAPPVLNVTTPRSPGSVVIKNLFAVSASPERLTG